MIRRLAAALALFVVVPALGAAPDDGFTPLFDGKSTNGWEPVDGKAGNWVVEDGNLVTRGEGGGWLSTSKTYGDFVLRLEFQVQPGGNSGVFIRSPRTGDPAYTGMEIQVLDDDAPIYKDLKPFQYCGSVYGVKASTRGHVKKPGEWNAMEIQAQGSKIVVRINGAEVVSTDLKDHNDAEEAHPGIKRPDGYIGLQSHDDPVKFRKIEIKPL